MAISHQAIREVETALNSGELMIEADYTSPPARIIQSDDEVLDVRYDQDHEPWSFEIKARDPNRPAIYLRPAR